MLRATRFSIAMLCLSTSLLINCGGPHSGAQNSPPSEKGVNEKALNLYIWADYLAPDTIASFEKLTGVKVHVSYFDNNEALESRMMTGDSGFDVVVPAGPYFQRQIRGGAYLALDKTKLPNLRNLDPAIMTKLRLFDPGNAHGIAYTWGTYGIGYNEKMVAEILPGVPVDSWRLIFDPAFASKLAKCGILFLDAPAGEVRLVLNYLHRDPNAPSPQDLADVESVLRKIRPYIRNIDSSIDTEALANGDVCVALDNNGAVIQARKRAKEANNNISIRYAIPKEGSLLWFDLLAIPRDAPHVSNAYLFINYLMNPQVIADISNFIGYANANTAATPLLDPSIVSDTIVFPTQEEQQRLFVQLDDTPDQARAITRLWQKFKTGQ